jgi:hypothetical protein
MSSDTSPVVNYDSEPVLEVNLGELDYRLDSGKDGTALCVSQRSVGSWDWAFVGEAKWDATMLRCKELHRSIREDLSRELRQLGND